VIHTDPKESGRETIARRVRAVADRNMIPAHNISVHDDRGRLSVDLHLEVDDRLLLHQAHDLASRIEQYLKTEIPAIRSVNTHIESCGMAVERGRDVTAREPEMVAAVRRIADRIVGRDCCRSIVIRRQGDRHDVSLRCGFDRDLPVNEAHRVASEIEAALKREMASVEHVLIHAEPESR